MRKPKTQAERPAGHDYKAELVARFGDYHLCNLSKLGQGRNAINVAFAGGQSAQSKPYALAEGIAIINISGVLTSDAGWYDETEYGDIQDDCEMAAADPDVEGILLRVNSPGGETDGAFETAMVLRAAASKKPMWAVADGMAYSGGYLLASCASKIYVPPVTGGVGSVGVYCAHVDISAALNKQGVKVTLISAGTGKVDGNPYEPLDDEAKATMQNEVNRLYDAFVASVSIGRGKSSESIRKMGARCCYGAEQSIGAGLADASGTLRSAWSDMTAFIAQQKSAKQFPGMAASAAQPGKEVPTFMEPTVVAADPKVIAVPVPAAHTDASAIVALCAIAGKSAAEAKVFIDQKLSAREVSEKLIAERVEAQGTELETVNPANPDRPQADEQAAPKQSMRDVMRDLVAKSKGGK